MLGVGGGKQLLFHQPEGAVHGAQFPFADDHLEFRLKGVVVQLQVNKAVGLQFQAQFQVFRRQIFKIGGVVPGGEGVDLPALGLEDAGELLGPQGLGAPEHQMLEEMRDAGDARQFVAGPHLVVNLEGDDGQTVIRQHEQRQAVGQGKVLQGDLGLPGSRIEIRGCGHIFLLPCSLRFIDKMPLGVSGEKGKRLKGEKEKAKKIAVFIPFSLFAFCPFSLFI